MFIALLLIIIGTLFLLKNLGIVTGNVWDILWPIILIALGFYIALKTHRCRIFWERIWRKLE